MGDKMKYKIAVNHVNHRNRIDQNEIYTKTSVCSGRYGVEY